MARLVLGDGAAEERGVISLDGGSERCRTRSWSSSWSRCSSNPNLAVFLRTLPVLVMSGCSTWALTSSAKSTTWLAGCTGCSTSSAPAGRSSATWWTACTGCSTSSAPAGWTSWSGTFLCKIHSSRRRLCGGLYGGGGGCLGRKGGSAMLSASSASWSTHTRSSSSLSGGRGGRQSGFFALACLGG